MNTNNIAQHIHEKTDQVYRQYSYLIGMRITAAGQLFELVGFNDLSVPYFSKVKNNRVQKTQYTVGDYKRAADLLPHMLIKQAG